MLQTRWDYCEKTWSNRGDTSWVNWLVTIGDDGWELVDVRYKFGPLEAHDHRVCTFKRPLVPPPYR